ncbi:MAG: L-threonylcarbamoyladenylate synthase [Myxococcota bacterium]|jgi:L-threonylcarbamoyladenylate synthase
MSEEIQQAAAALRAGRVVAFPTETVYGLGADARNPLAVRQIFALKGRPANHPLIVHLHDAAQAEEWGVMSPLARDLARTFWPGPLTLIVQRQPGVPDEVTGGQDTVGLRVPAHPLATALLAAFGGGLAAPSANRFGRISPTTAQHIRDEFGDAVMVLDGGPCTVGVESTIVDLSGEVPALLRPGGLPVEAIEPLTGPLRRTSSVRAPGTLASHYAPRAALLIHADPDAAAARLEAAGQRVAILRAGDDADYARRLYAELRRLDALGVDVLVAEPARGGGGLALAINDRLARAAAPRQD